MEKLYKLDMFVAWTMNTYYTERIEVGEQQLGKIISTKSNISKHLKTALL